jgi:TatD DNase family protein
LYPGRLFATAGVHPHHATTLTPASLSELRGLLQDPAVVAAGECGLDYYRDYSPRAQQRQAFALQLQVAAQSAKPVFLHQRDAHPDFVAILREHMSSLRGAVVHCFTAGESELEAYLALGAAIGITGWFCDERRGAHLASLVARIPSERLMLETDAPYLLPRNLPKPAGTRRNEPMHLPHIGAAIARARDESTQQCAERTSAQARRFFSLPDLPAAAR